MGDFFLILHETSQSMSCRLAKKQPDDAMDVFFLAQGDPGTDSATGVPSYAGMEI